MVWPRGGSKADDSDRWTDDMSNEENERVTTNGLTDIEQ